MERRTKDLFFQYSSISSFQLFNVFLSGLRVLCGESIFCFWRWGCP
jgi:hypothetical protein